MITQSPKGYRFPVGIIDYCVFCYHRFNLSYLTKDMSWIFLSGKVEIKGYDLFSEKSCWIKFYNQSDRYRKATQL